MAATQVTYVMGTAEVKRREPNGFDQPYESITSPTFYDGKCSCCPYGYHIDLDFVNYCESMANGGTLKNLRRIQRTKRKLRKSMEVMLQQDSSRMDEMSTPPPDVVHSTEASRLMNMVEYEQTSSHQVLHEIDSSVDARIQRIMEVTGQQQQQQRYASSDSDENYYTVKKTEFSTFPRHNSGGESFESSHIATSLSTSGRTDSLSSLSSVSTLSSEHQGHGTLHTMQVTGMLADQDLPDTVQQKYHTVTSAQLAATLESHMSTTEVTSTTTTDSHTVTISRASLQAIREAVAVSLKRMKELEEQAKAIPILQVRISVLKEEKRLLMLQAKANRNNRVLTRTVGTGDNQINIDYDKMTSTPRSFDFQFSPRAASPMTLGNKTPPAVSPKPKIRHIGIGDHSVIEPYLLQPFLPTGYTTRHNEVQNEIRSHTYEREIIHSPHVQTVLKSSPRTVTRSIGVGDGNVMGNSGVQIHEKELRTVIIGGPGSVSKRNVGIECRVPTRDVGIMYVCDEEKPATRTVGINVDTGSLLTSLSFKKEELSSALREVLHHSVRSIGINCNLKPQMVNTGTSSERMRCISVGCGDDRIDIDIRPTTIKKSVGVVARPEISNRSMNTERGWMLDSSTNTPIIDRRSKGTSTDKARQCFNSTNTESVGHKHAKLQTDMKVFLATDQMRNTGSNTSRISTQNKGINTQPKPLTDENFDFELSFFEQSTNTDGVMYKKRDNTIQTADVGVSSDSVEKEYDDEEIKEDYYETYTTKKFEEQVPITSNSNDSNYSITRKIITEEQPVNTGYTTTTKRITSSIPVAIGSSGSSSVTSGYSSSYHGGSYGGSGINHGIIDSLDETDDSGESTTRTVETTRIIGQEPFARGYSISSRSSIGHTYIEPTDFVSSHIIQAKESIKTNPNPYDYGTDFSGLRHMKRRTNIETDDSSSVDNSYSRISTSPSSSYTSKITTDRRQKEVEYEPCQLKDVTITEEDVENAQGYMRYLSDKNKDGSPKTKTMSTSDLGFDEEAEETMTTVKTVRTVQGGSDSSQNKMKRNSKEVDMNKFMNIGGESNLMETSADSGFGSGYSITKSVRTLEITGDGKGRRTETRSVMGPDGEVTTTLIGDNSGDAKSAEFNRSEFMKSELSRLAGRSDSSMSTSLGGRETYYSSSYPSDENQQTSSSESHSFSSDVQLGDSKYDSLKSCIKRSKSDTQVKRGITFADSVVGGTGLSSEDSDRESDSDSASYDEGSYDGRQGKIVYSCQDDVVIASGVPGAQMFDQNIRETFELSSSLRGACVIVANYLEDSTTVQTRQLNTARNTIMNEWFQVTNNKLANAYQIEDYMSSFNEISRSLLKYIVNMTDDNGNTAIHYAVSHCNFEVVSLLLDTEACDIDKPNKAGYTALMLAALASEQTSELRAVVQRLFSQGNINAKASQAGQTALMLAVSHGRTNMVRLLLDAGADVNQRDDDGSTALMCACEHGHTEIVKLLLGQVDCDASLTDNDGSTALEIAMEAGHKDIGVILYAHLNFSKQASPAIPRRRKNSNSPTNSL
ncbi:uncharacterized protein LOC126818329 isoform X2 [Patella vulgata]|uniref:uncharacterized protein LOC126818329 isoform X2 n=1 Tax=Patella vulgata TaxID=6465 RepID=UPI00217FA336|nr:uncharacterized protein LOC126818329 isoform X2 [Patella vulgata]